MGFNTFGKIFTFTSFGESHGKAIGAVVDGCPAGIRISEMDIQKELDRRRPGQSGVTTARSEEDKIEILSGVFEGSTTGMPIAMLIYNKDMRSRDYSNIKDVFRPGHADFTYEQKFGIRDYRGGGRSSARETAMRVAAGAIAKKFLAQKGIGIKGFSREIAGIVAQRTDCSVIEQNPVRAPDMDAAKKMEKAVLAAKDEGDSVGGIVEVVASGVPIGLGEPVYYKLDSKLAEALMSINALKGVEIGSGFGSAKLKGSQNNDAMHISRGKVKFSTNNSGGISGGISNGDDIICRIAIKPASSISKEQQTVDRRGKQAKIAVSGRHDPCLCPRAVPVAEAMVAVVLMDMYLIAKARKK
ncbi:MAG TPA: chorismate synthase [Candidatus Diapherotrites archaeon]|uniref:Chorismate synthase n=1 Tax=Candidatus Iainarchaeum sp. TaxID=3101447 RepID=A0A7J4IVB6_9ARCH|nr:chorismate synthase [Candidatus Diapherotrites archaeon]